jgi:uncharacterized radical SAM protein YgiQ
MNTPAPSPVHLPITVKEAQNLGWDSIDVVIISGDAYVDHPSFGTAVIGRLLQAQGLQVAIVPQPNWQDDLRDFKKFGKPNLFFAVTAGCMDSMVNHYTAARRRRSNDAYTPGGNAGFRPDRATVVYTRILKQLYPDTPVIIGGIEASMRRLTHYDYWDDELKPGILASCPADLLVYGMGEKPLQQITDLLKKGAPISSLTTIPQTALMIPAQQALPKNKQWQDVEISSHEQCQSDAKAFAHNFKIIETESNKMQSSNRILQRCGEHILLVNPAFAPMNEKEMDTSFDLPYTRLPHPKYKKRGAIPAYEMIKFSVNMHRGCFGGCAFCAISAHQGKFIASRTTKSIFKEIESITHLPGFTGHISDLGGPSANMYGMSGKNIEQCKTCVRPSCIFPNICSNLNTQDDHLIQLYQEALKIPGVKRITIGSGIRYDIASTNYKSQIIQHHTGGRLKVAPEHTEPEVLKIMRKPDFSLFVAFKNEFDTVCKTNGLKHQLIPYFISSHPGSTLPHMQTLANKTKQLGYKLEQVQDFTPTPMTLATVIYYSGYHPYTLQKVYTARTDQEKQQQKQKFFWYKQGNHTGPPKKMH